MDARTITEVRQQMTELQISLNQLQTTFNSSNQVLAERVVELDRLATSYKSEITKLKNSLSSRVSEVDVLACALEDLFESYKDLVDSGDAGNWKLEDTEEGKKALVVLAVYRGA
jgi:DNA repair exonuclease SbcCD ATPase subunit